MCFEAISQVMLMFKFDFSGSVCNVFRYVCDELYFLFLFFPIFCFLIVYSQLLNSA